ncbi:hypothetical protein, partial [Sphingobium psychrophilum]|uniref:hypothetical protein n=1 Tax=Sphingobium psychrophilum TaxID=2728834 RepID=UPI0019D2E183
MPAQLFARHCAAISVGVVLPHEAMFPSGIAIASRKCSLQEITLTDYSLRDWGPRSGAGGDAE